jgi:hypothetical protein
MLVTFFLPETIPKKPPKISIPFQKQKNLEPLEPKT